MEKWIGKRFPSEQWKEKKAKNFSLDESSKEITEKACKGKSFEWNAEREYLKGEHSKEGEQSL